VHPETGELIECPVKAGDTVLISDYVGEKVEYNGEKHIFIDANSLLGVFDGGKITVDGFAPLGDRVLVAVAEAATQTTTGIALSVDEDEDGNQGQVVSVGPGARAANGKLNPVDISPGESVMYMRRAGSDAKLDGKKYKIVSESECVAKW
jgi:chaperonin GroES